MSASIAQEGRFGRGIIATVLAILAAIPGGCRIANSNQLKDARQSYVLAERGVELRELRRRQLQVEEDIRQIGVDIAAAEDRLAAANQRFLPVSTSLDKRLRALKRVEEDLAAAKKREKAALDAQAAVLAAAGRAEEFKKKLAAAEASIQAQAKALAAKQAAIADLTKRLQALAALDGQLRKLLDEVRGALPPQPKPKTPPKKK